MTALLEALASLPDPIHVVLVGVIGGVLGVVCAHALRHRVRRQWLGLAITVIPVIGLPALTMSLASRLSSEQRAATILTALKQTPLLAAALESDPALEPGLARKIAGLARLSRDHNGLSRAAETLALEFADSQFNALAPDASEDAILRYLKLTLRAVEALRAQPQLCVAFVQGKPGFDVQGLSDDIRAEDAALKARIIREGAQHLSPFRTPLTDDDLRESLMIGYRMTGRNPQASARFAHLDTDPAAGCAAAEDYMTAVASLEAKRAAKVFKTLLLRRRAP